MDLNRSAIESQILSLVHQFLLELEADRAVRAISLDVSLEKGLGVDSLGKVELLHRIEKHFSIRLPEKSITEIETLRDVVKFIETSDHTSLLHLPAQQFNPPLTVSDINVSSAKNLVEVLQIYSSKAPNRPHVYLQNEKGEEQIISYGKLFQEAESIAKGLIKRGIQPGETIAIMLPTSDAFFYTFCGVLLAGAVPVPIYPPFRADRIEEYAKREAKILQNAQARILITFSRAAILSNMLRTFIPSLKEVVTIKDLQTKQGELPNLTIESTDPVLIQYTSGSTGDPKGVLLTHENFLANLRGIGKGIPIQPTDICVSWLPLYHDMGLMNWLGSLYFGIPTTILSPLSFLTRPERWLWTIHYHRATISGGPNFAYELCVKKIDTKEIEGLDLSSWRFAFNGAEGINPKTLERFYKKFAPYGFAKESFAPVYGLAENTVGLTFAPERREPRIDKISRTYFEKECKAIPATNQSDVLSFVGCGEVMSDHELRIVNDAGIPVSERIIGNIEFKGPSSMQGYFNNPAATQKAYDQGWWLSGDLGYLVGKELFITGRKKDLIIKAGRNLYPEEVEEIVSLIPSIRKGCVVAFGVNDANSGTEKLIVVAETYDLSKGKKQQVHAQVIEEMATNLGIVPDAIIFVPPRTIPKTSSGKLQRSACKKAYLQGKLLKQPLPAKLQLTKLALLSLGKKISSWLSYAGKLIYLLYVTVILTLTIPFVYLGVIVLPKPQAAKLMHIYTRNLLRILFCPMTIEGKITTNEKMIFVANHASYVDAIVLIGILPSDVIYTAKKEVLNMPFLSTFIKKLGYIPLERMDFSKSLESKNQIQTEIIEHKSVVIFPEGTFTYATGLRPFKLGAFNLAAETNTPICPISINGTRAILRGENWLPKPGPIKVTLGKPIYPKSKEWSEILRLHAAVRAEIAKYCGEPVIDVIVAGPVID